MANRSAVWPRRFLFVGSFVNFWIATCVKFSSAALRAVGNGWALVELLKDAFWAVIPRGGRGVSHYLELPSYSCEEISHFDGGEFGCGRVVTRHIVQHVISPSSPEAARVSEYGGRSMLLSE